MADIQSITQAASYRGDANIGGHIDAPVVIDDTPIQRFTTFKFYSDQAKWQQKQIDDATAAKQIARVTAFDISSPLTPYSSALKGNLKEVQDYIRANPNALVYSKDPGAYSELQNKIQKFDQLRQSATASDAVYAANKNAIDKEPDLATKSYMQADLDTRVKELFNGGLPEAQNRVLASSSPLKADDFQIPDTQLTKYDAITSLPNSDVINKFSFINPKQAMANAELVAGGLNKPALDENSASFKSLSPERQALERQRTKLSSTQRQNVADTTKQFNDLLSEFKTSNPDTDISQIKGSPDGNTLTDIIKSANGYNDQIKQLNALIAAGNAKDKTGRVITDQYDLINVQDGLSPAELIFMQSLQKSKSPIWSLDKTITETNDAIELQRDATARRGQNLDLLNGREGRELQKTIAAAKEAGKDGKTPTVITDVAEYMLGHIQRVTGSLGTTSKDVTVPLGLTDPIIKKALNLGEIGKDGAPVENQATQYKQYKDGRIDVMDKAGKVVDKLDLNILKSRVAQVLHGGASGDIDAKSQEDIEKGFGGTKDLNKILQEEIDVKKPAVSAPTGVTTQTRTGKDGKTYSSTDGTTWTASDGTVVTLKK